MGTAAWVVCCLLCFLIAFPCYLATRGRLMATYDAVTTPAVGSRHRAAVTASPVPLAIWPPSPPSVVTSASAATPLAPRREFVSELEEVARMHKQGHLSGEEFRAAKARILRPAEG